MGFATGVATKTPGDCKFGGKRVCSGSVVRYFLNRRLVRQCIGGVFVTKTVAAANAAKNAIKRGGEDCVWYGRVYCDGDVMIDLYRWWFQMRCASGKMRSLTLDMSQEKAGHRESDWISGPCNGSIPL